ncbi:MAG: T9SS type A sorting domain-containing protein [Prolixibacteraceae bacterium]
MKNLNFKIVLFIAGILLSVSGMAQDQLAAFPGAEGHGKYTTGGRGGKVIYVTNLEDNTLPGSLRYAVTQSGPRIVVFAVSGTIQLKSVLDIKNANITIAGQTAPGDGICLRDYSVTNNADNVIIRYMRFRMGDETKQQNDCIWGRNHKNIILDHCSMSWNTDECSSFYDNTNFTMQWCLLSESLRISVHDKGSHGYGGIWGGKNASFHHNLLADHDSRNPRFCGSRYSNRPDLEKVDYRNNVIFNWGANSCYAAEGGSYNMVNNYYKAGPASSSSSKARIIEPYADDGSNSQPMGVYGKFYITGNVMTSSTAVTEDNWIGVNPNSSFATRAPGVTKNDLKSDSEFPFTPVSTHTAEIAYQKVLDFVGASLVRDTVDRRIIQDTRTGNPTFMTGGNGSKNGLIDTQSAVGGWPELISALALTDTDLDGMPDDWEDANGLKKNDASDAQLTTVDGIYPNVEVYLNSLVATITENQLKDAILTSSKEIQNTRNDLKIFLNNSTGLLQVIQSEEISQIRIYSLTGSLLKVKTGTGTREEIQMGDLHSGIYIVSVKGKNGTVYSGKIVKN